MNNNKNVRRFFFYHNTDIEICKRIITIIIINEKMKSRRSVNYGSLPERNKQAEAANFYSPI